MAILNLILVSKNEKLFSEFKTKLRDYDEFSMAASHSELIAKIKGRIVDIVLFDEDFPLDSSDKKMKELLKYQNKIGIFAIVGNKFKEKNEFAISADYFITTPVLDKTFKELIVKVSKDKEKKKGFYNYLTRPIVKEDFEKVLFAVHQFMTTPISFEDFEKEHVSNKSIIINKFDIVGKGEYIDKLKKSIEKIAKTDMTVLIVGESGTGKEVIAKNIYYKSLRNDKPFVTVNCAAISPTLIEAELFGYEKGAFTGANVTKAGIIEEADGGTLFLDEIGDMEVNSQAKLLRVIEYGEFRKVGGSKTEKVNVRFIAATNKNLKKEVENGNFRKDLYYRLFSYPLYIKPLRERKEVLPLMIDVFMNDIKEKLHRPGLTISDNTMKELISYSYPGNVRELKNILERISIISDSDNINEEIISEMEEKIESSGNCDELSNLLKNNILEISKIEKALILRAICLCNGNKLEAAKMLGIGRTTLYDKLEKYGIRGGNLSEDI